MSRLSLLRVADPVLTNLAYGYHNNENVGEVLMPICEIDKEAGKIPTFGREAFRVRATIRGLSQASNRVTPEDMGSKDVLLDEHDLEYPIDYRETNEADFDLKAYALSVVQDSIHLVRERQIANLATNPANYAPSNKILLSGTSQFSDPDADVFGVFDDARTQIKRSIGHAPNAGVIPLDVFKKLKVHPQLIDKIKYVQKGILTIELLGELLDIPNLKVGCAVNADDNDVLSDIWSKHIALAYVPQLSKDRRRTIYEPSYGYTIRRKGGLMVDVYDDHGGKIQLVRCTDIMRPHLLGADAGFLIQNAV